MTLSQGTMSPQRTRCSARDKLGCAMRELAYRHRVYPRLVASRRMSQRQADREIELMTEILEDYALQAAQEDELPLEGA